MTFGSFLIGYERQNHLKVAGVRTHLIVCLAAAIMKIYNNKVKYVILLNGNIGGRY